MQQLEKILQFARANYIPVMLDDTRQMLFDVVSKAQPKRILEIGTAIGYSGIIMLTASPSATLNTIEMDEEGNFSFDAKFERIGDNQVLFRSVQEGKKDTIISFSTYYLPSLAEYSKNAWQMDYDQLKKLTDVWKGRVFLCRGYYVETLSVDPSIIVMNVGSLENPKYVVMKNESAATSFVPDTSYDAYADVDGQYMWNDKYYPCLVMRYINKTKVE